MKNNLTLLFTLLLTGWNTLPTHADDLSVTSGQITAHPVTDRIVLFKLSEPGIVREVEWGADEAWMHEQNLRRCILFMGKDNVSIVRVSFQPTYPLVNGDLQQAQKNDLKERLRLLGFASSDVKLSLNCDHPSVDSWYRMNAENWAQLIDVTAKYFQEAGYEIVSVSPFNEPDYGWNQWVSGSQDAWESLRMSGFKQIAEKLRENSRFDNVRICGGNTLNCDRALPWYNYLKENLDEGNTHQLAGSFDSFANFYTTLKEEGKHATADEMHNVMEAMVGMEYGLQTGIWWGPAEYARGEFCKASHGERLGYAEHRNNWTAASVYRAPDGKVQAFGGTSERQSATTTYRFVSKDRDVFYNGHGPQREFVMELPGGTGYQNGQTNAEQVVNITWGEDVQPVIDGTYYMVNKSSSTRLLEAGNNGFSMGFYSTGNTIKWNVNPVDPRIGGDFSYYYITSAYNNQAMDVLNWSLEDNAEVIPYTKNNNANQQWYLEYAGDNWFYIRNRHSSLCLEVVSGTLKQGIQDGSNKQLWRFATPGARPRITTPATATGITAKAEASSVLLTWNPAEATTSTFTVLRSETPGGSYDIIARNLQDTAFTDNKVVAGRSYHYVIKVVDQYFNTSAASTEVSAVATGAKDLVAHYEFEENTQDTTVNKNHGATLSAASYSEGKTGKYAISLNGTTDFVQLPAEIANRQQLTIAAWINWKGGNTWQRIFDFGNGENEYMFLTPNAGSSCLRFAIKNNGDEQYIDSEVKLTDKLNTWIHVAVTLDENNVCLYQDGELVASSKDITIRPNDFKPVMNYIGRSQFSADPMFKGSIDDFRVYNFALTEEQIYDLANGKGDNITVPIRNNDALWLETLPGSRSVEVAYTAEGNAPVDFYVYDIQGRTVLTARAQQGEKASLSIAGLSDGVYILKAVCGKESCSRKFIVQN